MALRSQKVILTALICLVLFSRALGQELKFRVQHKHLFGWAPAWLHISNRSISFLEQTRTGHMRHAAEWSYQDIRQLWLADNRLIVVTYRDKKPLPGRNERYVFRLSPPDSFLPAFRLLRNILDQRLIAAIVDPEATPEWELPAKLAGALSGHHGLLLFGPNWLAFASRDPGRSRTWRFTDIDVLATLGPMELVVFSYEDSPYPGFSKEFRFQLKQQIPQQQFESFWKRLQASKGLVVDPRLPEILSRYANSDPPPLQRTGAPTAVETRPPSTDPALSSN